MITVFFLFLFSKNNPLKAQKVSGKFTLQYYSGFNTDSGGFVYR